MREDDDPYFPLFVTGILTSGLSVGLMFLAVFYPTIWPAAAVIAIASIGAVFGSCALEARRKSRSAL